MNKVDVSSYRVDMIDMHNINAYSKFCKENENA